ncbi:DUF4129 domain-containing protein [Paenibacillus sp.]|uniref:DUF4129 domain-containing protein n=1 Tax=Paenibacillus sp. TaxID=58172 RepID=UPI002811D3C3|nr:DUF4129 domain-containing protein [Paenibacillus sp.]
MNAILRLRTLWISSSIELLLLLPVWLALYAWLRPPGVAWAAVGIAAASFAGAAASLRWNRRWQQLGLGLLIGAAFFGSLLLAGADERLAAVGAGVGFIAALQGLTVRERNEAPQWLWYGLALYFVAAIVYPRVDALRDTVTALTIGGAVSLAVALFASNGTFLRGASLASSRTRSVPATLRRHNRAMMAAVLLVVIALTAAFGNAFGKLLFAFFRWLFGLLPNEAPAEEAPAPEPPPQTMPEGLPAAEGEPGLWAQILDIIGYAIGIAAALALLFWLGRWLYRNAGELLREWLRRLAAFLTRSGRAPEDAAYVDEETTVFSWESAFKRVRESWLGRLVARSRAERWEDQRTNAERVRYLYRRWLRTAVDAGYESRRHLTPRETEADVIAWAASRPTGRSGMPASDGDKASALVELYDRVRYGDAVPSDGDVERTRRSLESKK